MASRKKLEMDRKKSVSALWLYVPATAFMLVVFVRSPAWWSGALLGLAVLSLGFDLYSLIVCTQQLRQCGTQDDSKQE